MDRSEREKLIGRAKALAAMADPERNPSKHEVEVAAQKLQALLDQYNISMLDVMADETDNRLTFTEKSSDGLLGQVKQWHWGLARVIARITSTRYFATTGYGQTLREKHSKTNKTHRGMRMTFFGTKGAVDFACELYDKWVVLIDKMSVTATSEYIKEQMADPDVQRRMKMWDVKQYRHLPGLGEDHPNTWRASWLLGVILGIDNALYEQEQARKTTMVDNMDGVDDVDVVPATSTTTVHSAIVIFKEQLDVAYADRSTSFRKVASGSSNTNYGALGKGRAVGSKINLTAKELKG